MFEGWGGGGGLSSALEISRSTHLFGDCFQIPTIISHLSLVTALDLAVSCSDPNNMYMYIAVGHRMRQQNIVNTYIWYLKYSQISLIGVHT